MKTEFNGRAWIFGDHIDTDCITPGKYENLPFLELCGHCLEPLDASFAPGVVEGDFIVAGENFGCGSAREIAPQALKELGVGAVIAKSFARTFFRNAVAIGLPLLVSLEAAEKCRPKDILSVDVRRARITNVTGDSKISAEPIPRELYVVLSRGGLFAAPRQRRRAQNSTGPEGRKGNHERHRKNPGPGVRKTAR
jgi:3-isopropylmalate/(R)-2-methylmalate dehydratase small subunit